ncbi:MAG: FAD-binding protein [Candidatus Eremiobacteraeota bacterium]|nr:FAD-binding protein [Candidatus Eremiobacteraeota bacterium]
MIETKEGIDVGGLAAALHKEISGEVRFDDGARAMYATDGSNYRQVPIGVVIPRTVDDVIATVDAARRFNAPILSRGGGTSLAGQCCNVAVVMDMSKYLNRILELDVESKRARVQPGTILDDLRDAAEKHHLTFAPDPSTHTHCTLGGMIGNGSCGVHAMMGGKTIDNVIELDILTYDGLRMRVGPTTELELKRIISEGGRRAEIYGRLAALIERYGERVRERYPKIPRRVSGYNLDELLPENHFNVARALVGTESTCVTILEATVRLVHSPPAHSLVVLGYPDIYSAGDHVPDVLQHKPIGLEAVDDVLVADMKTIGLHPGDLDLLPSGNGWLLAEFGGETKDESDGKAQALMHALEAADGAPSMKLYDDPVQEKLVWRIRESGLGATAKVTGKPDTWEGWEDSAVPPERVGEYLRELRKLYDRYGYQGALYGHLGQGCIHTRVDFDLESEAGIAKFRSFITEAAHLVVGFGGSLSGEHGDGQARAELLPIMFGDELIGAFREFKAIWDPQSRMNPRKVVDAYRLDENLRLGTTYAPPEITTHFQFPADEGSFARAALRCVGVGNCRRTHGGTMCPSYMVTREEADSTRGRARLLFEMLKGETLADGWRDEAVKESLDLCFACKGCKGDCPVNVDMATYKAEFLSHYYAGRVRPRTAYAMGLIAWWSRLAALAPGAVNVVTRTPLLRRLARAGAGIARERAIPTFAAQTFTASFRKRRGLRTGTLDVLLWPDTFSNHFLPERAQATVEVLERFGFRVSIPEKALCCGRPLYDWGMLDLAKRSLREILVALREPIRNGVPIVGIEPSCVAVFRDELCNLFPHDEDAKRLSRQTFTLSEFLLHHVEPKRFPKLRRKALVQGHCHHKAIMKMKADESVLQAMELDVEVLDAGCCGMAGSFGFEQAHYDISVQVGERALLPKIRDAEASTLVLADGFSCREQIGQLTDRRAHHLAEIILMAFRAADGGDATPVAGFAAGEKVRFLRSVASKQTAFALGFIAILALTSVSAAVILKGDS